MISVGSDGGHGKNDDINIMKRDCQENEPGNGCVERSYEYNGIKNALCGSDTFDLKRFYVIQMIELKEMVKPTEE